MAPNITSGKAATMTPKVPALVRAYVTFLAGNGDYVKGVVGLAKGLRKVKSKYPLVVAVLPDVPEDHRKILLAQGCLVKEIEPVYPPENQTQFAMAYYIINYSKLRIWKFVEYSKMIYLDGDIQVFDNIDHLFYMEDGYFYAVMDCFCEKTWSHTLQYKIGYCQQCPNKVTPPTPFAEQKKAKVVHYCAAGSNPWRYTGKEENVERDDIKKLVAKWWDIYNDRSLDYSNVGESDDNKDISVDLSFWAALTEADFVHYINAPSAA
ncbi:Galactinol synthase 2 [Hibiscus syriacus]|uniref:Hexosyltransferase n=1 Tax=Hibiscus syriacus TaxID=106335 RepID=A0A6A2XSR1_HIBSY|nr:Galactinol synthase 2 [Hibiscus syriacus]